MDDSFDYTKVNVIDLPKIIDERGNLSFIEAPRNIPFEIKRVYWIYDVPGGEKRGGHAYKNLYELIIAISGSFDVTIDTGTEIKKFTLNRSYKGVYIPKMVWRSLDNFSTNSLCLILASNAFDQDDYIRDYNDFKSLI
jgi:dTDP-4-dehydrorhamnose 3,5-epimerase-like enzyme